MFGRSFGLLLFNLLKNARQREFPDLVTTVVYELQYRANFLESQAAVFEFVLLFLQLLPVMGNLIAVVGYAVLNPR